MKKCLFYFLVVLIFLACNKEDNSKNGPDPFTTVPKTENPNGSREDEPGSELTEEGNILVKVEVKLPEGSSHEPRDLEINSVFGESALGTDGKTELEIYNGQGLELAIVFSNTGHTVLMGYLDPSVREVQAIDYHTTAKAIIMLHPQTIGMEKERKIALMSSLPQLTGYKKFLETVEKGIQAGDLSNIDPTSLREELGGSLASKSDIYEIVKPLEFFSENDDLRVSNDSGEGPVFVSYQVDLLRESNKISSKLLLGDLDSQRQVDFLLNGQNSQGELKNVSFRIKEEGKYKIYAQSGLYEKAFNQNLGSLIYEQLGLITSATKEVFKFTRCFLSLIELTSNHGKFRIDINDYLQGKLSGYELGLSLAVALKETFTSQQAILEDCLKAKIFVKAYLKIIISALDFITKGRAVYNSFGILKDWNRYNKEIEFCFERSNAELKLCQPILASGSFDFGRIPVGLIGRNTSFSLENRSDKDIEIKSIKFPSGNQFYTIPKAKGRVINARDKIGLVIWVEGPEGTISGDIVIETDQEAIDPLIFPVTGEFIEPFEIIDAETKLPTDELIFQNIRSDMPQKKSFILRNITDYGVLIFKSDDAPDGFDYDWPEFVLDSLTERTFDIVFEPSEDKIYDNIFKISNNSDKSSILLALRVRDSVFISDELLDFGQVDIDGENEVTKKITVTNPGYATTEIKVGNANDVFKTDRNSIIIEPGATEDLLITFNPNEIKGYNHTLELVVGNGKGMENLLIGLNGEGIDENEENNSQNLVFEPYERGKYGPTIVFHGGSGSIRLTNISEKTITLISVEAPEGFDARVIENFKIYPKSSYNMVVGFFPQRLGTHSGSFKLETDDGTYYIPIHPAEVVGWTNLHIPSRIWDVQNHPYPTLLYDFREDGSVLQGGCHNRDNVTCTQNGSWEYDGFNFSFNHTITVTYSPDNGEPTSSTTTASWTGQLASRSQFKGTFNYSVSDTPEVSFVKEGSIIPIR